MADRITMNFDEVDEIVYIADIETYELLYINRFGIRQLTAGGSRGAVGKALLSGVSGIGCSLCFLLSCFLNRQNIS
ncbi:MAG: hypothetical protein ACLTDX_06305 [[Clostridium] innocuum]